MSTFHEVREYFDKIQIVPVHDFTGKEAQNCKKKSDCKVRLIRKLMQLALCN